MIPTPSSMIPRLSTSVGGCRALSQSAPLVFFHSRHYPFPALTCAATFQATLGSPYRTPLRETSRAGRRVLGRGALSWRRREQQMPEMPSDQVLADVRRSESHLCRAPSVPESRTARFRHAPQASTSPAGEGRNANRLCPTSSDSSHSIVVQADSRLSCAETGARCFAWALAAAAPPDA
jgi:hypothetical protein